MLGRWTSSLLSRSSRSQYIRAIKHARPISTVSRPATRYGQLAVVGSLLGLGGYYLGALSHSTELAGAAKPVYGTKEDFGRAIKDLKAVFPSEDAVSTNPDDLAAHGISPNTWHPGLPHSVVVYPQSTEDVVKIVQVANQYRMPVIPYSGGTSLEGHYLGGELGGICVDMSRMDKILAIHEADSDLVCQPGVGWMEINETLKDQGIPLFFPLDPGPTATIGGMLSTGCSGTNAVRYGTARGEWFLNATIVLPSGEVIKTRRRSRKSSAGFDVTKLFIGAEGTLGIVTEVTVRLAPLLPTTVAIAQFPNVRKATEAVVEILNRGVGIQCIELTDAAYMHATNLYGASERKYEVADHLFFKLQGPSAASLKETARIVQEVVKKHGGSRWSLAKDADEAETMWTDRKNALYSGLAYGGEGTKGWSTDVCVPISQLPELVYETQQDLERSGIKYTMVGHAGDGNFHALMLFKTEEELATVRELVHRMVERALALDGTCTGEHGVGVGKKEFLVEELGPGTVKLMKTIKKVIDPHGLFNPGKLYPDDDELAH
ncbi:FAD-binding domain-containing protein [Artomyces pyxidatus]|uniref:FAD-binding domain-containing protein n=1 Tax=Artomyces pyxidatus TaxID=48021 RepID=A0ACB8SZZ5_9AGAM|nr:FAD-binding domain-containing protein [Artomyces pyxidatus]